MSLFKIISNGHSTYLEIDGKTINCECINNIEFSHDARGEEKSVTMRLDIDIKQAAKASERGDGGFFEDDDCFEYINKTATECEKKLCEKHSEERAKRLEIRERLRALE